MARRPPPPGFMGFQRPKLVAHPPAGAGWLHEIKFDGYRLQTRVERGRATLFTRRGFDWSAKLPELASAAGALPDCILDGELCLVGDGGRPQFSGLRAAIGRRETADLVYFPFDVLWAAGVDLRPRPLHARKEQLAKVLQEGITPRLRPVEAFHEGGQVLLESACRLGLEGIVSKRLDAPYVVGESDTWCKAKCKLAQEFVVGGWVQEPLRPFRALLVGVYDDAGGLTYVGSLERGFPRSSDLLRQLAGVQSTISPFQGAHPRPRGVHWARPTLVCQAEFQEWTASGKIRHASFKGLRDDKYAAEVRRERIGGNPE